MNDWINKLAKVLLFVAIAVIFYFAFSPGTKTPAFVVNHDKAFHFMTFFGLALVVSTALPGFDRKGHVSALLVFAIVIELVQLLFVHRGFSFLDIWYDVCGISVFYLLMLVYKIRPLQLYKGLKLWID